MCAEAAAQRSQTRQLSWITQASRVRFLENGWLPLLPPQWILLQGVALAAGIQVHEHAMHTHAASNHHSTLPLTPNGVYECLRKSERGLNSWCGGLHAQTGARTCCRCTVRQRCLAADV